MPHFFSVFFACLYQKYFSEKIEQLFAVFFGTDEHADINKNEKGGLSGQPLKNLSTALIKKIYKETKGKNRGKTIDPKRNQ